MPTSRALDFSQCIKPIWNYRLESHVRENRSSGLENGESLEKALSLWQKQRSYLC